MYAAFNRDKAIYSNRCQYQRQAANHETHVVTLFQPDKLILLDLDLLHLLEMVGSREHLLEMPCLTRSDIASAYKPPRRPPDPPLASPPGSMLYLLDQLGRYDRHDGRICACLQAHRTK